jgi:hypothetical protein
VSRLKVAEDLMETVAARVARMEAELRTWGAKLDALIAAADAVSTGAKIDYRRRLGDMKTKYEAAQMKLDELRFARSRNWESVMDGIENAWNDLEAAFRKIAN